MGPKILLDYVNSGDEAWAQTQWAREATHAFPPPQRPCVDWNLVNEPESEELIKGPALHRSPLRDTPARGVALVTPQHPEPC